LTETGVVAGTSRANAASGTMVPPDVLTAWPLDTLPLPVAIDFVAWLLADEVDVPEDESPIVPAAALVDDVPLAVCPDVLT
jgi:hypothetical protein